MDIKEKDAINGICGKYGFTDTKWIEPKKDITVAQWVRFRCMFGCDGYGESGTCPPAVPPVAECREMIHEYSDALIFHFPFEEHSKDIRRETADRMLELEREIFLAGYYKTFLLNFTGCGGCETCVAKGDRSACVKQDVSRPSAEAMGVDVYKTARDAGFPIQVLKEKGETQNRYAILLIE